MRYEEALQTTSATVLTYLTHGNARTAFVQQGDGSYTLTFTSPRRRAFAGTLPGACPRSG